MKLKYFLYTLLIFCFTSLIVYRILKNKEEEQSSGNPGGKSKDKGSAKATTVSGYVITNTTYSDSLAISGSIEANEQVQLRSQINGLVTKIYFTEGNQVTKGQNLVKIDDSELRAQLSQLNTRLHLAQENERRASLLLKKEGISREEYEISQTELKSLQAQLQLINAQINKTVVRAPFSGKIGLRNISEGSYLSPETVIANLLNTNPVKISFAIPEKYSSKIKTNTELTFTVSGSSTRYKAIIYAIEPGIDPLTRTLQIKAKAANPTGALLPGTFANIKLPLSEIENAILIPTESVIPVQNGKKVFISENGKAKDTLIETSSRTEKYVLVTSGLKKGDTVITSGVMSLKKGAQVKIKIEEN